MTRELIIKKYAILKGGSVWEAYYDALLKSEISDHEIAKMKAYINDLRDCNLEMLLHVKLI